MADMMDMYNMGLGITSAPSRGLAQGMELQQMKQNIGLNDFKIKGAIQDYTQQVRLNDEIKQILGNTGDMGGSMPTGGAGQQSSPSPASDVVTDPTSSSEPGVSGINGGIPGEIQQPSLATTPMQSEQGFSPEKMMALGQAYLANGRPEIGTSLIQQAGLAIRDAQGHFQKVWEAASERGDDSVRQGLIAQAMNNPSLRPLGMLLDHVKFTGPGETKLTAPLIPQLREYLLQEAGNDQSMVETIKNAPNNAIVKVETKDHRIVGFEVQDDKNLSDEQLIKKALKGDLEAKNILDYKTARDIKISGAKAATIETEKNKAASEYGFTSWTPQQKENAFQTKILTGRDPTFGWGDKIGRSKFGQEYNQYMIENNITPNQVAAMQTDYKSQDKSMSNQRKNYDMMNSFVLNLNKQMSKVEQLYKQLPRTDLKILNMPIVTARKYVTGSGEEAAAKSYLIEISNEIGKLSTGSSNSIRELSESAQRQWKDIHDEKLSFKDLMTVLNTTREQVNMRLESTKQAMAVTKDAIMQEKPESMQNNPKILTKDIALQYLNKFNGDKKAAMEAATKDGYAE